MMEYKSYQETRVDSPMTMSRGQGKAFREGGTWGVVLASLLLWVNPGAAQTTSATPPAPSQERFLQNFISNSLAQPVTPQSSSPVVATPPAPAVVATSAAFIPEDSGASPSLTAAAFRMVLGLGGILAIVVAGGYGVRRFLLERPLLGKRDAMMRVLGRVSLTPKAGVALVEVPGKILVVGITSQAITILSDLPPGALPQAAATPLATPKAAEQAEASFEAALKHHTRTFEAAESPDVDPLATVSQAIHRKISGLKQL